MTPLGRTGRDLTRASGAIGFVALAACSPIQIGSRVLDFGGGPEPMPPSPAAVPAWTSPATAASAETFGRGPVPVALLLPLSGDPALAQLGRGLANASRQAIAFVEQNPNIAENITITLRDTGSTPQGAMAAAQAAVAGGARLVLGPLTGDQVSAAATVTRQAGVPMIAFANNPAAAGSGVYLLSVLPEAEFRRSFGWAKGQGKRGVGGIFPATPRFPLSLIHI
jgi:outer membrane PBP1 activator LpoA protein